MDRLIIKAGTLIKVYGVPVELIHNTFVYGNKKNFVLVEEIDCHLVPERDKDNEPVLRIVQDRGR